MVRVEKPSLGPGKIIEQLAPWETFQVLGPHSGVDICDSVMIKRYAVSIGLFNSPGTGRPCQSEGIRKSFEIGICRYTCWQ